MPVKVMTDAGEAALVMGGFAGRPGLYLHVPFCASICPFCPYNKVLFERELARAYFDALETEISLYLQHATGPFASLYIGGGTPTLCIEELGRIMTTLPVAGERAIEVLPGHATEANLARLGELGINYLSLGVQSFDQAMLDHLRRPNTVAENYAALTTATGRFDCIDVDLIFDVAFEDESVFLRDLEICFNAEVGQVSTYPLMRFGYTPFGKTDHEPAQEHRLLHAAEELAEKHGYERRSVWTFNRCDSPTYTSITREFYLGCGAGSGTYTGSRFLLNHFSIPDYIDKLRSGHLPIARATCMSRRRAAAYYLFWQIYTGRINIERFDALFRGQRMLKTLLTALKGVGLLQNRGDDLVLSRKGYDRYHDLERWVTYHFIEPLWADMMHEHAHLRDTLPALSRSDRLWLHLAGLS